MDKVNRKFNTRNQALALYKSHRKERWLLVKAG